MRNFRRKAFTIAELVTAMMVIGAIGMILMPTLIADNEKQVLKVSLEKAYSTLTQSAQAASLLAAQGKIAPGTDAPTMFKEAIQSTQKVMRNQADYLDGYDPTLYKSRVETVVLKNSIIIMRDVENNIAVDVNGTKNPNIVGRDIYYFTVGLATNGELIFNPYLYEENRNCKKDGTPGNNVGCADFILNYGGEL